MKKFFQDISKLIRGTIDSYKDAVPGSPEGRLIRQLEDIYSQLQEAFAEGIMDAGENFRKAENTTGEGGVRYFTGDKTKLKRITATMTDSERANILCKKQIVAPVYTGQADAIIKVNEADLESHRNNLAKKALVRIGEEFEVFKEYNLKDVDVVITLSRGNLKESAAKESSPVQLAKLLPVLNDAIENAVGIESHENRYYFDNSTVSFDNLIGGYVEGDYFVPIRFGLKNGRNGETTLYVVVDQEKIKAEVLKTTTPKEVGSAVSRSAFIFNLSQIVPFVNSKDVLRYLPDDMLSDKQKAIKWAAISETIKYTKDKNDSKYIEFIRSGNVQAAQMMVIAAAKAAGYSIKAYHGTTNQEEHSTWNAERREWETTYSPITVFKRQYDEQVGHFFSADMDNAGGYGSYLYSVFLMLKKPLVIECNGQFYNSISFDGKTMDTYEWAEYAHKHRYDGVIFKNVRDGVDYGAISEPITEYVVFDSNRIKSADPITYDKDGNVIPLSERFNPTKRDIRYSVGSKTDKAAQEMVEKENAKLREDVAQLKELLKLQGTQTHGTKFTPSSVEAAARYLKKNAGAKGDTKALTKLLTAFYEYIATNQELTWEGVREQAKPIANWLMDHREHTRSEYAQEVLDQIRGSRVYLDESQMAEAAYRFESYDAYRKSLMGSITLAKDANMSLDSWWHEMSTLYPDVFDASVTASDMPSELADVVSRLRNENSSALEYEHNRRWIEQDLCREVYDSYWRVNNLQTFATCISIVDICGKSCIIILVKLVKWGFLV